MAQGTANLNSAKDSVTVGAALPAGNNNIGDVDIASIAAGNNNIGDVDVASIAAGNNNIGDVDVASLPTTVHTADFDTGAGTDTKTAFGIAVPASGGAAILTGSTPADGAGSATALNVINYNRVYNGSSYDRMRGDTSGVYNVVRDAAGNARGANVNASNQLSVSVDNTVTVGSHAVTNAGTFAVQVDGNALTSLQLIDDVVYTDDTSTHATGTSKGALIMGAATPTDTAVNANDIGAIGMTNNREMYVSLRDISGAAAVTGSGNATGALRVELANNGTGLVGLNAGSNAIGKLAANSGVDIGDVDVTSISAGTNLIGDVGVQPRTTNGLDTFMASGSDGSSILVATAQSVKGSAGKVYGYYLYNPEAAVTFVHFYNTASGSVTVGTTNPLFTLPVPAGSAANLGVNDIGITFGTAITIAATTTAGGNTAPATGVSAVIWYK